MIGRIARPRSLLVVAPHPDDETIGAHTAMARLRRRGVPVRVVIVSDGAASHPGSRRWPERRLVAERKRETRLVLRRIGVPAGDVTFLDYPDGRLHDHAPAITRAVRRAAAGLAEPVLALAPSPHDDHPDHRVVAASARRQPGVHWLRYPVWPAGQHLPGARPIRLTGQERMAKRNAIRSYRTQTGRITDDPSGFVMVRGMVAGFCRSQEVFADDIHHRRGNRAGGRRRSAPVADVRG